MAYYAPPPDLSAFASAASMRALADAMPLPADAPPASERTGASAGSDDHHFAKADHQHPRLTSAQYATTKADGLTDPVTFTRAFASKPCAILTPIAAPGVDCDVASWVQDGAGAYVGAVVRATSRNAATPPSLVTVLGVSVVGGVTTTTQNAPVGGCELSVVMLAQSAGS